MARAGTANTKMLMLREGRRVQNQFCSLAGANEPEKSRKSSKIMENELSSIWVPHPRTGIYVPKGHEWVMDDVPDGAASFSQAYWLRNVDGVDKPDPDHHATHDRYPYTNPY